MPQPDSRYLGYMNFPSQDLLDALAACRAQGHKLLEAWHGAEACRTTYTCESCGFHYDVDSSD